MFAYCNNNPVNRSDPSGKLGLAVLGALATQYASDILGNVISGKTGVDLLIPTSSLATYTATAITALIPGSKIINSLSRSIVAEAIQWTDNALQGKSSENNLTSSIGRVIRNTALDYAVGKLFNKIDEAFDALASKDYTMHVRESIESGRATNINQVQSRIRFSNNLGRIPGAVVSAVSNVVNCYLSPD